MKILIVDIETSGLHWVNSIILEIGLVELDLETGDRKIVFDSTCHNKTGFLTKEHIEDSWVVKRGWMTVEEIRSSVDFRAIKEEVQNIINQYPLGVTAYNRNFDIGFLQHYGITFTKLIPCPMVLSTPIVKAQFNNKKQSRNYKWPNVEEAYNHFFPDNDYTEIHRGADDAFHEAQIVYELYKLKQFTV